MCNLCNIKATKAEYHYFKATDNWLRELGKAHAAPGKLGYAIGEIEGYRPLKIESAPAFQREQTLNPV